MNIPKIIHQIWIGGSAVPETYAKNTARLVSHNPGWTHRLWGDADLTTACAAAGVGDAYEKAQSLHNKVDIGRYAVLATHGGVTVDMDVVSLQPLDTLTLQPGILSVSECSFNPEMLSWENRAFGFPTLLNNAFFAAPPGLPIVQRLCRHCADLVLYRSRTGVDWIDIIFTTGPLAVSRFFGRQPADEYRVIPCRFVEPLMNFQTKNSLSHETVLWHIGSMSWIPSAHKRIVFFAFLHRYAIFTVVVAAVSYYTAVFVAKRRRSHKIARSGDIN